MSLTDTPTVVTPAATPVAEIELLKGKESRTLVALFDTGAQKTFISKHTVESLGLPTVSTVSMAIDGFLANKRVQKYNIVRPVVKLGRYKHKVTLLLKMT